ncbi:hypothetical protein HMPREF9135_1499 [Segatella baroniae F0067]|uniref:Uncharacterized protein n=1 Tax=Segatella baroniae F0067 TaxID=1115809 RepID=U2P2T4_9BACT|nr:hypothetical protein HMPREF9135_1499 [Segatella baroniae F0067]
MSLKCRPFAAVAPRRFKSIAFCRGKLCGWRLKAVRLPAESSTFAR